MEVSRGGSPRASLEIPVGGNGRLYGLTSVTECPRSKCFHPIKAFPEIHVP